MKLAFVVVPVLAVLALSACDVGMLTCVGDQDCPTDMRCNRAKLVCEEGPRGPKDAGHGKSDAGKPDKDAGRDAGPDAADAGFDSGADTSYPSDVSHPSDAGDGGPDAGDTGDAGCEWGVPEDGVGCCANPYGNNCSAPGCRASCKHTGDPIRCVCDFDGGVPDAGEDAGFDGGGVPDGGTACAENCGARWQNAEGACNFVTGTCEFRGCKLGYLNCNLDLTADGCEVNTFFDFENCGNCKVACSTNNTVPACEYGGCAVTCDQDHLDCNQNKNEPGSDGCEINKTNDPLNCGTCAFACNTLDHVVSAECLAGMCRNIVCAETYWNNDNRDDTGCEYGPCTKNAQTGGGEVCNGQDDDCNGTPDDGALAVICPAGDHAVPDSCLGVPGCHYTCVEDYGDCDNLMGTNGCETNIKTDLTYCGACGLGHTCAIANGTPTCDQGVCKPQACNTGYKIDGVVCTKCDTTASCGSDCGSCPTDPNGVAACAGNTDPAATSCSLTCNSGYWKDAGVCKTCDSIAKCGSDCQTCPTNAHGTYQCSGNTNPASTSCALTCNTGYAGTACDTCAGGYTGYPNCTSVGTGAIEWPYASGTLAATRSASASRLPTTGQFVRLWIDGTIGSSPTILSADLDGNGSSEVVASKDATVRVYGISATPIITLTPGCSKCWVGMLQDVNGDGVKDIGVGSSFGSSKGIYFYKGDGTLLKSWTAGAGTDGHTLPVAKLSSGQIILSHGSGYSCEIRGLSSWTYATATQTWAISSGIYNSVPAIADVDGNGVVDLFMAGYTPNNGCSGSVDGVATSDTTMYSVRVTEAGTKSYVYNLAADGGWDQAVGDLDGAGLLEVLYMDGKSAAYPGTARLLRIDPATGAPAASFNVSTANAYFSIAVANFDADPQDEVVVGSTDGKVFVLNGMSLTQVSAATGYGLVRFAADVDGDGATEVVVSKGNDIAVLTSDLTEKWTYITGSTAPVTAIPVDVDGDGRMEIAISGSNGVQLIGTQLLPPITANLILGVETKSTVDLNAINADTVDFPGTYFEAGWLCWEHSAAQDKYLDPRRYGGTSSGDDWPVDIALKYCVSASGDFYVGGTGATSDVIGLASSSGEFGMSWTGWGRESWLHLTIQQSALSSGLFFYWIKDSKSIVAKNYAANGALTLGDYGRSVFKFYNGFSKSLFVVEGDLFNGDGPSNDRNWEANKWSPQSTYSDNSSGKRTFSLDHTGVTNSFVLAHAACDNSNSSYLKADGQTIATNSNCCTNTRLYPDLLPSSVELGYSAVWSNAIPEIAIVTLADSVSITDVHEWNTASVMDPADSLDKNPRPMVMEIKPGWTVMNDAMAQYYLDDYGGSTAADSGASAMNGTVNGSASYVVGLKGSAINFDGANDYISIPDNDKLDFGTGPFSVVAWMKTDVVPDYSWHAIFTKHNTANWHDKDYGLWLMSANCYPAAELSDGTGVFETAQWNMNVCDNAWHMLAAVRTPSKLQLWVDGILRSEVNATIDPTNSNPVNIGRSSYNNGQGYYQGLLDEIEVYDRALSQDEIQRKYAMLCPDGVCN